MLTEEDITKFQSMFYSHFGRQISREEAYEKGTRLLLLMKNICQPMSEESNGIQP